MTQSATAQTNNPQASEAGRELSAQLQQSLSGEKPDVVIVFASPEYEYVPLLEALSASCKPGILIGCSSAGEFTESAVSSASASAIALRSTSLRFRAGIGRNLRSNREQAAKDVLSTFHQVDDSAYRYKHALVLVDALAGYTEDFLEQLTVQTAGRYQFFGGGAGDDARFSLTHVFFGTEAITDGAVALEILSTLPFGLGVGHGWTPAGPLLRVTEAEASRLGSLNATPAAEVFAEHAAEVGEPFDPEAPIPFFLHHVIGINTPHGYKLRVPLTVNADQSISCAADVPAGSTVSIMSTTGNATTAAAGSAVQAALAGLGGAPPAAALFFDCAATRLRMGKDFGTEIDRVTQLLGHVPVAGCNTYGQIARVEGQFSGFHNCTAVVCIIPRERG